MTSRILATLLLAIALLPVAARADEDDRDDAPPPALSKTMRLEFQLVTPEDTPSFVVLCAGGDYAIDRDVSEPNGGHAIKFKGTLTPADDQGRLRLTFDAMVHHANANEGIDATFTLTGSALLTPGKQRTLGVLGEAALKVTAVEEE
jgi:hypothetical protein